MTTALALGAAGWVASVGAPPSSVVTALLIAFVPYAGLVAADARGAAWPGALALAVLPGIVFAAAPSVLSDDVYRYLWDGRVSLHGQNPYAYPPEALALASLRDEAWTRINHRDIPTIYPPLSQLYFVLGDALWPSVHSLKALALGVHLACAAAASRLSSYLARTGHDAPAGERVAYLTALNPLALSEAALGGHVDVGVGLLLVLVALSMARRRDGLAALGLAAASGLKLVGLSLWPLLWRRGRRHAALALVLGVAMLWPLMQAGSATRDASGLQHYAQRWSGNAGVFRALAWISARAVDAAAERLPPPGVGPSEIELAALRPLLTRLRHGPFDPRSALDVERKERRDAAVIDRAHVAGVLARAVAAALALGLACALGVRVAPRRPVVALRLAVLAILLLSPQVHPWYLLWLLPLELALGRRALLLWSAAGLAAYAPLDGWLAQREWSEDWATSFWQYGWVIGALLVELVTYMGLRVGSR